MTAELSTAEVFKGNPYFELFGDKIDHALYGVGTVTPQIETIIKMAELYENRTLNMLAFEGGEKRPTTKDFKDASRGRVNSERPASDGDGTVTIL